MAWKLLTLMMIAALLLAGCGTPAVKPSPTAVPTLAPTQTISNSEYLSIFETVWQTVNDKFQWLDRLSHTPAAQVRWRDTLIAIGLGLAITIIQLVFCNDPGAVVR